MCIRCCPRYAQVLAAVFGPKEVESRAAMQHDRAIIRCQVTMAAFSTLDRTRRTGMTKKATETSKLIRNAIEQTVMASTLYT